MFDILDYQAEDDRDPFKEWLAGLADRQARARVAVRVQRMAAGNFGDHKPPSAVAAGRW
jgi:putative addiction module killer protein